MSLNLPVSVFHAVDDNRPTSGDTAWPEEFLEFDLREDKHAGPLWSPALYRAGATRLNTNVTGVSALVLDMDPKDGRPLPDMEAIALAFQAYEFVIHTSYSHADGSPAFRVIFPFDQPVTVAQHAHLWRWAEQRCLPSRMDPACKDPARMYYTPTAHPSSTPVAFHWPGTRRLSIQDAPGAPSPGASSALPTLMRGAGRAGESTGRFKGIARPLAQVENISAIEAKCAFMKHARENAVGLGEPEWYAALSVWVRCKNGDELAHANSSPDPRYTFADTEAKIERAKSHGPTTCIRTRELSDACQGCPFGQPAGPTTSPVLFGRSAPVAPSSDGSETPEEDGGTSPEDAQARAEAWLEAARAVLDEAVLVEETARAERDIAKHALRRAKAYATDTEVQTMAAELVAKEVLLRQSKDQRVDAERAVKAAERATRKQHPEDMPEDADPAVWASLHFNMRDGTPRPTRGNIRLILENDPTYAGMFKFDEFARSLLYADKPAADDMDTEISTDMEYRYRMAVDSKMVAEVAYFVAKDNGFHPVKDYLNALTWDAGTRLDDVFSLAFRAVIRPEHAAFYRMAARKFFINCVARIYEPGTKMDYMLVLTGVQYAGKSWGLRRLVSPPTGPRFGWFADTKMDIGSKDSFMQLAGNWWVEVSEMDSFKKYEASAIKAFLASQEDNYRPPFGRHVVKVGRETVFVGTTNQEQFLTDPTGNRRFLVISVGEEVDIAWINANREQLWAEAYAAYAAGEDYKFTREDVRQLNAINDEYREHDVWEETVQRGIIKAKWKHVTIEDVLCKILQMDVADVTKIHRNRAADVLRSLKCTPCRPTLANGERPYAYAVPDDLCRAAPDGRVTPSSGATDAIPLFGRRSTS